jgi:hypothetical protein
MARSDDTMTTTISTEQPSPLTTVPPAPAAPVRTAAEVIGRGLLSRADQVQQTASSAAPGTTGPSAIGTATDTATGVAAPPTLAPPAPLDPSSLAGASAQLSHPQPHINLLEAVQLYYMTSLATRTMSQNVMDEELKDQVGAIEHQATDQMKAAKDELIGGIVGGTVGILASGMKMYAGVGANSLTDSRQQAFLTKWTGLSEITNSFLGEVPKTVMNYENQMKQAAATDASALAAKFQAAFGETQTYRQDLQSAMAGALSALQEFMQAQASVANKIFA